MTFARRLMPVAPIGIAYFVAAVASLFLARLHNGVPFLWIPASIMIVALRVRPMREWWPVVVVCAAALFTASATVGGGLKIAGPMTIINMVEGVICTLLLNRARAFGSSFGTVGWLLEFAIPIGLIGPGIAAGAVLGISALAGVDGSGVAIPLFCGHALGNLMFTPLTRMAALHGVRAISIELLQHGVKDLVGLLLLVAGVTYLVFSQNHAPILFLVFVPMILLAFRLGFSGSVMGMVIIATIAGWLTVAGYGPVRLMKLDLDGTVRFLQFYLVTIVLTVLPVAADLRNRADLLRDLRMSGARYQMLAAHSTDILLHLDLTGRILYVSPSITQIAGFEADALVGTFVSELVSPEERESLRIGHLATLAARGQSHSFEFAALTSTGGRLWFESGSRALLDEQGNIEGTMCMVRDITERKEKELHLSHEALTDPLTGLCNRRGFEARVAESLPVRGDQVDCIAVFDIDHFKRVNDGHGHDAGDAVLKVFSRVLRHVVRETDAVARVGGEEFAVYFPSISIEQALRICERVRMEMAGQTTITGGDPIRVTVSGGVAEFSGDNLERALKQADQALYAAKRGGRDQMALAA